MDCRTMFIPHLLIIFFPLIETAGKIKIPICDKNTHVCLAPMFCDTGKEEGKRAIHLSYQDVATDCPIIFRFYAYKKNFVHITIESFNENVTSARIEQSDKLDQAFRNFSCSRTNGTVEGRYNDKIQKSVDIDEHFEWSKLRCDFQVTISKSEPVMGNHLTNLFWNEDKTTYQVTFNGDKAIFTNVENCDPNDFKFEKNLTNKAKIYQNVLYQPEKYYCDNSNIFTIEYKKDDSKGYVEYPNATIKCEGKSFKLNEEIIQYPIEIRCSANASFFCDEKAIVIVKPNEENLTRTAPDIINNIQSSLSCPNGKPHAIADKKLYRDARFECVIYGDQAHWEVSSSSDKSMQPLDISTQEIYCTDTLKCSDHWKISASSVFKGTLSNDNLPECFEGGTLLVNEKNVTGLRCDNKTGEYKYATGGPEKTVEKETKFECNYPTVVALEINEQNENVLYRTLYISIGISLFLGIAIIICGITYSNYRIKERKKVALEKLAHDELAWNQYVLNEDEREELKYAKKMERMKLKNGSDDSEKEQSLPIMNLSKWNDMQLNAFSVSTRLIFKDATTTSPPVHLKHMDVLPKPDDELIKSPGFVNEKLVNVPDTATKHRMREAFAERLAKQFK